MQVENKRRVVITGMGIVSPFGIGLDIFNSSIRKGISAISLDSEMKDFKMSCQVSARPPIDEDQCQIINKSLGLVKMKNRAITYGLLSVKEAWEDAGLDFKTKVLEPRWETGCIYGNNSFPVRTLAWGRTHIFSHQIRKLGSYGLQFDILPYITGSLGLGNATYTTAQACATGSNAIILAYERIKNGQAKRMITGSSDTDGPLFWSAHDALHVLCRNRNDNPESSSSPMSSHADGIVPSSGAATLILEDYEFAKARGAKIYAEIIGGAYNNGGQIGQGSRTMPNSSGIVRVVQDALQNASISSKNIDVIAGHLTSTKADPIEIYSWVQALDLPREKFPIINSLKSMIGHSLAAAGSMAVVASVLQIKNNFIHASINCEDLHPEIADLIDDASIPHKTILDKEVNTVIQASFGFGDTNAAIVLRKLDS